MSAEGTRVDFYVLAGAEARARLLFACRLAEKAYLSGRQLLVWLDNESELQQFDDMLWTFADRAFVPHEPFQQAQQWQSTPVLLSCHAAPDAAFDVLLNLAREVPGVAQHAQRVLELVDSDEERRRAGRNRFRQYRERGLSPETRNIAADEAPQAL